MGKRAILWRLVALALLAATLIDGRFPRRDRILLGEDGGKGNGHAGGGTRRGDAGAGGVDGYGAGRGGVGKGEGSSGSGDGGGGR